jgi:SynChlorMet cassette protein ScmC
MTVSPESPVPSDIVASLLDSEKGYCLRLASGQGWRLIPTKGVEAWLDKMAAIMELERHGPERYPSLIFIEASSGQDVRGGRIGSLRSRLSEALVRTGWKAHYLRTLQIWSHRELPDRICEMSPKKAHSLDIIRMWLALHPVYQSAQDAGGLPLHAALVGRNGAGVLLAGSGDVGKSTCCRLLPDPWQTLCDDETLIVRASRQRYVAHPFPTWSDRLWRRSERTWNVQRSLSVTAIFFLEQAKNDEIIPLGQARAAVSVFQSAMQVCQRSWKNLPLEEERLFRRTLFHNACELARAIPAFTLRFSLSGQFWIEMDRALRYA